MVFAIEQRIKLNYSRAQNFPVPEDHVREM